MDMLKISIKQRYYLTLYVELFVRSDRIFLSTFLEFEELLTDGSNHFEYWQDSLKMWTY